MNIMKSKYWLYGIITLVIIGIIFISGCTQTKTVTKYVCSDGNVVYSVSSCPTTTSPTLSKNYDYFTVELDAMGSRGNEDQEFGDGWIDLQDCLKSDYAKDKSYTECNIQDVQILTGSDPNPLKINTNGPIFNNGVIFKIKCACSK